MMALRKRLNTTQRQALYDAEVAKARELGRGEFPICNICDIPVVPPQDWDESHWPVPHSFGGKITGIAHRRCNRRHGSQVVTPLLAKSNSTRAKHVRAYRPQTQMPFGRDDRLKSKIGGGYEWRDTGEPFKGFDRR